jgi:hypothetical protein
MFCSAGSSHEIAQTMWSNTKITPAQRTTKSRQHLVVSLYFSLEPTKMCVLSFVVVLKIVIGILSAYIYANYL